VVRLRPAVQYFEGNARFRLSTDGRISAGIGKAVLRADLAASFCYDSYRLMVLKNSLSTGKGTPAAEANLCNRALFDDFTSRKASAYPERIRFRVFQQNRL